MTNFVLIFVCLAVGQWLRRARLAPENAAATLNVVVLYLSLPAVVLLQLPPFLQQVTYSWALLAPVAMPWAALLLAWGVFAWLGRRRGWPRATIGALIITSGLGNTSFVGFPVLDALLGPPGVQIGVLIDQLGSFCALSTLGLWLAARYSGRALSPRDMLRRVMGFPPLIAILVAIAWSSFGAPGHAATRPLLEKLAATLAPLAVLSVGVQLNFRLTALRRYWEALSWGLSLRLLALPACTAVLLIGGCSLRGLIPHATVLEIAMPPMITASVVAAQFKLDEELTSLLVGLGIMASLGTLPLWHLVLQHVAWP